MQCDRNGERNEASVHLTDLNRINTGVVAINDLSRSSHFHSGIVIVNCRLQLGYCEQFAESRFESVVIDSTLRVVEPCGDLK